MILDLNEHLRNSERGRSRTYGGADKGHEREQKDERSERPVLRESVYPEGGYR